MKNLKITLSILLLLISTLVSGQEALNNYLKTAGENNPAVKAKFDEYMSALQKAPQVKALPDPQVAFAYFMKPVETKAGPQEFKFSASQMFPWFGTLKAKENASLELAKAKYEMFSEAKSKLFQDVKSSYFNLYFNTKAIEITKENINILASFQKLAIIKVEAGMVSLVDEYRIEMEIGDLENQLALLRDKQILIETVFNKLLNVDKSTTIIIPATLWDQDIKLSQEAVLDSIQKNNHQILSLNLQQESLKYRKEAAKKAGKPSFNLGFDYTFVGKGDNNAMAGSDVFVFPKVGITIPLYRKKYKAMVREVLYLESAKTAEKVNKTNALESLLEKAWFNYRDADRRIDLYLSQFQLAERSIKLIETSYITGNKNFEEILRMERRLLKYNLELEKAHSDKHAAIAFVHYLMGR